MPGGYVQLVVIIGLYTLLVLWPLRLPRGLAFALFFVSHLVNELPGLALGALLAGTVLALIGGHPISAGDGVILALAALSALGLLEVIRRGLMTAPVVEASLDQELGSGWRAAAGPARRSRRLRLARELLAPLPLRPRHIQRIRNLTYGEAGRRNRLDVYRPRGSVGRRPAGVDPLPWRPLSDGRQEPRGAPVAAPARRPRLGLRQRQLPARCGRPVPQLADRRQAGDQLGADTRR